MTWIRGHCFSCAVQGTGGKSQGDNVRDGIYDLLQGLLPASNRLPDADGERVEIEGVLTIQMGDGYDVFGEETVLSAVSGNGTGVQFRSRDAIGLRPRSSTAEIRVQTGLTLSR